MHALPAGEHVTVTAAVTSFTRHPVSAQSPRLHVRCRLQDGSLAGLERKQATVQWTHAPDRQAGRLWNLKLPYDCVPKLQCVLPIGHMKNETMPCTLSSPLLGSLCTLLTLQPCPDHAACAGCTSRCRQQAGVLGRQTCGC